MEDFFQSLKNDRERSAEILEKPSMGGVRDSVVEKYTEQAHFIYELLQNADDVKATKVKFILDGNGLIFIHNGTKKFSVSNPETEKEDKKNGNLGHINAITSIGHSSKIKQQIGKFGVGFKAVFQYTNTPKIYDDNFQFEIKRFIVPVELKNDHSKKKSGETLFHFPFDHSTISKEQAYKEILFRLKKLNTPLLFINNLKQIDWETEDENGNYSKVSKNITSKSGQNQVLVNNVTTAFKVVNKEPEKQQFLVFTEKIEGSDFDCSVAYHLKDDQIVDNSKDYPAYCFFPTRERTNLKFIIQAPFILIDNRQGIKRGNRWNTKAIQQLAELTAKSISIVKKLGFLKADFFNALPLEKDNFDEDGFYMPFFKETLKKLSSDEPLLPTKEGDYTTKEDAYLAANSTILELFSSKQLSLLFKGKQVNWVFPTLIGFQKRGRSTLGTYLSKYLNIKEWDTDTLVNQLHIDFIKEQSDNWLLRLYEYLADVSYTWRILNKKPIIRTENNEHLAPLNTVNELQVFLPSELQSEFPTIKAIFLESEKAKRFFDGLKVRKPDLKAEIEISILPQYRNDAIPSNEKALNHFEIFFQYYLICPQRELYEYLEKLKEIKFIKIQESDHLKSPKDVYFKNENLLKYFKNYSQPIFWLDEDFYQPLFIKYKDEKEFNLFFDKLGVSKYPKILAVTWKHSIPHRKYFGIYNTEYTKSRKDHFIRDYRLEGLQDVLPKVNIEQSLLIWNFYLFYIKNSLLELHGEYNYFSRIRRLKKITSFNILYPRRTAWLFNKEGKKVKPSEITIEELSDDYIKDTNAARELIELLEIKKQVQEWEREFSEEEIKKMYQAAQKAKGYTDEDFEELRKIKQRRLAEEKQASKPKSKKKQELVESTDLQEVLDKITLLEKSIQGMSDNDKTKVKKSFSEVKKKIEDIQAKDYKQKLLFFSLMSIQDFASELAHIIKTSLYNVMNMAKFIKNEFPNPDFNEFYKIYANEIHYEMTNLEKAVDFILGYATIDENLEKFDVKKVIEDLFNYSIRDVLDEEKIAYEVDVSESVWITYNKKAFEDIIENLITNSIKALKGIGEKRIHCRGIVEEEQLLLYFSDNGYGIEEDRREKIFNIYETSTKEQGGSGIGLFSVKTRLNSLNGDIEVIDNESESTGATFKITLPFKN